MYEQPFIPPVGPRFPLARLLLLVIPLILLLVISGLLYWLALPVWQLRLNGTQTRATAHALGICDNNNDGGPTYSFSYEFTALNGQHYNVPIESHCNNAYSDGDTVTIWYESQHPTSLLTDVDAVVLYIFSAIGGVVDLALLIMLLVVLFWPLLRRKSSANYVYPNSPYDTNNPYNNT